MLAAFARSMPRFAPAMSTTTSKLVHTLPDLDYGYEALEPVINREIMEIHHTKHHQTYVNNLNTVETAFAEATSKGEIEKAISLDMALRFNGGGHINHTIFWKNLSPNGGGSPKGDLLDQIIRDFGSFDRMRDELSNRTIAVQGSGWGWLGFNPDTGRLRIATCANQDPLKPTRGLIPLLGIDVWEHAYYLQYKNVRPSYVKEIWNIINWEDVSDRLAKARLEN